MQRPIAQITCRSITVNVAFQSSDITKICTSIRKNPLEKRKNATSFFVLPLLPYKKILVPERNTNTGAQKWVIHLVKNKIGVVLEKSRGAWSIELP